MILRTRRPILSSSPLRFRLVGLVVAHVNGRSKQLQTTTFRPPTAFIEKYVKKERADGGDGAEFDQEAAVNRARQTYNKQRMKQRAKNDAENNAKVTEIEEKLVRRWLYRCSSATAMPTHPTVVGLSPAPLSVIEALTSFASLPAKCSTRRQPSWSRRRGGRR